MSSSAPKPAVESKSGHHEPTPSQRRTNSPTVAASSRMLRRQLSVNRDISRAPMCSSSSRDQVRLQRQRHQQRRHHRSHQQRDSGRFVPVKEIEDSKLGTTSSFPEEPPRASSSPASLNTKALELREKILQNQAMQPIPVPFYTGSFSFLGSAFVAGAFAGSIADLTMHPVDTINTRMKVSRGPPVRGGTLGYASHVVYSEGLFSLYRGIGATMAQALPMNAFWFVTYEGCKQQGMKYFDEAYAPAVHFCSAGLGELVSSIFYVPFDVVKTRMQLGKNPKLSSAGSVVASSNYSGTFSALKCIWRSEGVAGLYSGYRACIVSDCSVSALQFMFYEKLKKVLTKIRQDKDEDARSNSLEKVLVYKGEQETCSHLSTQKAELDSRDVFWAGAMAGSMAAFLTNPVDTMTARLMTQGQSDGSLLHLGSKQELRYGSGDLLSCARSIMKEEGAHAFMRGWFPRSVRFGALGAIQLAVYEKLRSIMGFEDDEDEY